MTKKKYRRIRAKRLREKYLTMSLEPLGPGSPTMDF